MLVIRNKMMPSVALCVRHCAHARMNCLRGISTRQSSTSPPVHKTWLEENCGDVPSYPRAQDLELSEMLRGGHALQIASMKLLEAELASAARGPATSFSEQHIQTLQELKEVEERAIERVVQAVEQNGFRFRPSATIPIVECSSQALGTALSLFSEAVSTSYLAGVKTAIADYYNDQIREIYASKPDQDELKELFKRARDDELTFVDAHTPDALDPAKEDDDAVRKFAKNATKLLLQISTRV